MTKFLPGTHGLLKAIATAPMTSNFEFAAHVEAGYVEYREPELLQAFDRLPAFLKSISYMPEAEKIERIRMCAEGRESIESNRLRP